MKNNILFLLIVLACCSKTVDKNKAVNMGNNLSLDSIYYNKNGNYNFTDKGSFWLLYFNNGRLAFDYGPNCGHEFETKKLQDRVVFYFDSNITCSFDKSFKEEFKGIESPSNGAALGELYKTNDSTVAIKYYYPKWVNKINEINYQYVDTLFPQRFKFIIFD